MRQREADGVYGGGVERELAGNVAYAIRPKQLLHSHLSPYLLSVIAGAPHCGFWIRRLWKDESRSFTAAIRYLRSSG
jgi:hypothetical protein